VAPGASEKDHRPAWSIKELAAKKGQKSQNEYGMGLKYFVIYVPSVATYNPPSPFRHKFLVLSRESCLLSRAHELSPIEN
jgi:hypothetical protein